MKSNENRLQIREIGAQNGNKIDTKSIKMVPKWRPEMTKSSKWLPKRFFGEKGRILTPLGGPWELNEVIFRLFWEPFLDQN